MTLVGLRMSFFFFFFFHGVINFSMYLIASINVCTVTSYRAFLCVNETS